MNIDRNDALIIIDVQNDFIPGGSLAVAGGDGIVRPIVELARKFREAGAVIALTQDYHPKGHKSFASTWYMDPFSSIKLAYGDQTLWPDHCVQRTEGADFHPDLAEAEDYADVVIRKGTNLEIDSYSAFMENDQQTLTGLGGYLKEKGILRVFVVGLAYDFCVGFSAIDAVKFGFDATVIKDLTRAIAAPVEGQGDTALIMNTKLADAGVTVVQSLNERQAA